MSYTLTLRPDDDDMRLISTNRVAKDTETMAFRLLDDDENVYFEGKATDEHAVLDALDRFAESMGCTLAQWWDNTADGGMGAWQALN